MARRLRVAGFPIQQDPLIYLTALPGPWLLAHTTTSWRSRKPKTGFQRIVREDRVKKIAVTVLDQNRSFPNAIVLATDVEDFDGGHCTIEIPSDARFLVVDGQHRLWAQKYSRYKANYACLIHMRLSEVEMARLFLEINDNQRRVPASLRWDLVRLVRPEDDPSKMRAAELVWELATSSGSPLYQRIDLTGEQKEISLKQGSLAPELEALIRGDRLIGRLSFGDQIEVVTRYLTAIRSLDPDGWRSAKSPFYKARVLRVLLRLLPLIAKRSPKRPTELQVSDFKTYLDRIKPERLSNEAIRAAQGSAGMKALYEVLKRQVRV